jgi:hypothetical protein
MPTLFSTSLYQQAVGIDVKALAFNSGETVLEVQYSVDEKTDHFFVGRRSTFGHLEFVGSKDKSSIHSCLDQLFQYVEKKHSNYTIKFAPSCYYAGLSELIHTALNDLHGAKVIEDCNQSVVIKPNDDVIKAFANTNRRIYRKLERDGYSVTRSDTLSVEGYDLLEENRRKRNVSLSLSYQELYNQSRQLRGYFHFFECRDGSGILCAYAVTLNLNFHSLYVFYWGERTSHRKSSPVIKLAAEIMKHCQRNGITLLDAGTSSVGGVLDQNLFDFKRRLGFESSSKFIVLGGS